MRPSDASLCSVSNFFFSGNVTNIPAVLQPSSTCQWIRLFTVRCQRFTHQPIVFCVVRPTHISLGLAMRAVSLFSSRAAALVSRVSRLRRSTLSRACTPLTKSEEKERLLAVYHPLSSRKLKKALKLPSHRYLLTPTGFDILLPPYIFAPISLPSLFCSSNWRLNRQEITGKGKWHDDLLTMNEANNTLTITAVYFCNKVFHCNRSLSKINNKLLRKSLHNKTNFNKCEFTEKFCEFINLIINSVQDSR